MEGLVIAVAIWSGLLVFYSFGRWDGQRASSTSSRPASAAKPAPDAWPGVLRSLGVALLVAGAIGSLTVPIATEPLFFLEGFETRRAQDTQIWASIVFLGLVLTGATAILIATVAKSQDADRSSLLGVGSILVLVVAVLVLLSLSDPLLAATTPPVPPL